MWFCSFKKKQSKKRSSEAKLWHILSTVLERILFQLRHDTHSQSPALLSTFMLLLGALRVGPDLTSWSSVYRFYCARNRCSEPHFLSEPKLFQVLLTLVHVSVLSQRDQYAQKPSINRVQFTTVLTRWVVPKVFNSTSDALLWWYADVFLSKIVLVWSQSHFCRGKKSHMQERLGMFHRLQSDWGKSIHIAILFCLDEYL